MKPSKIHALAAGALALALVAGCRQKPGAALGTAIDRKNHAIFLAIDTGAHVECTCKDCHDPASTTFATFDCIRCHQGVPADAIHAKANMGQGSQGCYACHKAGGAMDPTIHGVFFPIGPGTKHAGSACASCHADATSRQIVTCNGCHAHDATPTTARHKAVAKFTYDPATCLACHADGQVNKVAAHAAFAIATGAHATSGCLECHTASRIDKPQGRDFSKFECTGCHAATPTNANHANVPGYLFDSASCYGCHASGTSIDKTAHSQTFFPIATGSHATASCSDCHGTPSNMAAVSCGSCHAAAATTTQHAALAAFTWDGTTCLACHGDGQVNRIADHVAFPVAAPASHAKVDCLACHDTKRADKTRSADFAAFDCATCHVASTTDPLHATVTGYSRTSSACYGCHSSGAAMDTTAHSASFFPISAGSAHANASCASCHTDPANRKTLDCTTCHAATTMTTAHAVVGGFTTSGQTCVKCHADSQVDRVANHKPFVITSGSHYRRSCLQCHPTQRTDKAWAQNFSVADCLGCHSKSSTDREHAGRSGYSYATSACLNCHPSGRGG